MLAIPVSNATIRPLVMKKDLKVVADIIETCFSLQHDMDGQAFLKQMRQAYRISNVIGDPELWSENDRAMVPGFVWEERGTIIGNVSIIPFPHHGHTEYLIANVAVLPAWRRKGVARALTRHAVAYLRQHGHYRIWLQVNQQNEAAIALYHGLGFIDHCCRTTWHRLPEEKFVPAVSQFSGYEIDRRQPNRWEQQKHWLERIYPDEIIWHYPVRLADFSPDVFWNPERWEYAIKLRHWQLQSNGETRAYFTWQRTTSFADTLWLAPGPQFDLEECISALFLALPHKVGRRRPLVVDLPCGMAKHALLAAQFRLYRSLIWMRLPG